MPVVDCPLVMTSENSNGCTTMMEGKALGDYVLDQIIGHGTFSTVWKAHNQMTGKDYAVKLISRKQAESSPNYNIKKEVLIQENLHHPNTIKLVESRKDADHYYLIIEWAAGGELFEKIEPDFGFPEDVAHLYFVQLLEVLKYLREQGVAHRDIKPENMLVDFQGNLKITDFGLATVFKQHGQRRVLQTPCGTSMYMAPEVIEGRGYQGDQVDLWSAAVVLFVMIVGAHPWEEPTIRCNHYDCFLKSRCHSYHPWNRFNPQLKDLLVKLLKHDPEERMTLDEALKHKWVTRSNPLLNPDDKSCADPKRLAELLAESHVSAHYAEDEDDEYAPALTQLEISAIFSQAPHIKALKGFSQPVLSDRCLSSSTLSSPVEADKVQHIQRLARFYTRLPVEELLPKIEAQLNTMLVQHKSPPKSNGISFFTTDKRKGPLTGDISVHPLGDDLNLVLFTKTKGDSLEFKRFFKWVIMSMKDIILQI